MKVRVLPVDISTQLEAAAGIPAQIPSSIQTTEGLPGEWRMLQQPVHAKDVTNRWGVCRKGTVVTLPLIRYAVTEESHAVMLRLGAQITSVVMGSLAAKGSIEEFVLLHSSVFGRADGAPGLQVWVGVAARIVPK